MLESLTFSRYIMIKTGLVLLVSLFVYFVLWAGDDKPTNKDVTQDYSIPQNEDGAAMSYDSSR